MLGILGNIISEFIAGMGVWYFTEGNNPQQHRSNKQVVYINNTYYINSSGSSTSSGSSLGDISFEGFIGLLIIILMIVALIVMRVNYFYAQYFNTILSISFWSCIGLSVIGGLLFFIGIYYNRSFNDASVLYTAVYSLVLCIFFGGLVWLIYDPPFAPDEYFEVINRLYLFNSSEFEAARFDIFFDFGRGVRFLFFQGIGTVPMLISMFFGFP